MYCPSWPNHKVQPAHQHAHGTECAAAAAAAAGGRRRVAPTFERRASLAEVGRRPCGTLSGLCVAGITPSLLHAANQPHQLSQRLSASLDVTHTPVT
jgi:hypothetical protein